jgi:ribosomal protein S18 acetylase RimI-like enzyme
LEWDSTFFGQRIGRARTSRLTPSAVAQLRQWCRENQITCLYFLADADHPETCRLAAQAGFDLVDIRVTFERKVLPSPFPPHPLIRPHRATDLPPLRELSGRSHQDTRFFVDARFSREAATRLYEVWLDRDAVQGAMFVVEHSGRPAAYVTGRLQPGGQRGEIGIIAVDASVQGLGLGKALVNTALSWFAAQGAAEVVVVTQGRNLAAQRLYQSTGFRTASVQIWYHYWPEEGIPPCTTPPFHSPAQVPWEKSCSTSPKLC